MPRKRKKYRDEQVIQCCSCKEIKSIEDNYTKGDQRTCRSCKRKRYIKRKYGLTLEEYEGLLKSQDGLCVICMTRKPLYIDHNHSTGKVRGILCQQCNTAIGYFLEDQEIMKRAIEYIKQ